MILGRRINRAINLKVSSFKFCDEKMLLQFKKHKLIEDFIIEKENDVQKFNSKIIDNGIDSVNNRRITNIGFLEFMPKNISRLILWLMKI
jgi:miniconductance mechanosensitive channel